MKMTTPDCQRINQRESAHPATGRGRRSAADGLDRRRSTRRHQFPVDGSDLDLDRCSLSRGVSENPSRYRHPRTLVRRLWPVPTGRPRRQVPSRRSPAAPTTG